jgi:hypothetical protein
MTTRRPACTRPDAPPPPAPCVLACNEQMNEARWREELGRAGKGLRRGSAGADGNAGGSRTGISQWYLALYLNTIMIHFNYNKRMYEVRVLARALMNAA